MVERWNTGMMGCDLLLPPYSNLPIFRYSVIRFSIEELKTCILDFGRIENL